METNPNNTQETISTAQNTTVEQPSVEINTNGFFKLQFQNGSTFEGDFINGEVNNTGTYTNNNGEIYKGTFDNNDDQVENGELTFDNGASHYKGGFKDGKFEGIGTLTNKNGDVYTGEFHNGLRHGKGKLIFSEGDEYEGNFVNGQIEGIGKLTIKDISQYSGQFKNGVYDGNGTFIDYIKAETYIGGFKNGVKEGEGMFIMNNQDTYDGMFKDGKFNGKGKYVYNDGNIYEGDFKDGDFNGEGKLVFANGDKYVGTFVKGIREGDGVFYFGNGSIYEGKFKNDSFDGEGILYKGNGDIIEGTIKNVTDFGAFVDLGGVDGLLHISEMSSGHVDNPKKLYHVDDKVKVFIKNINGKKIALSCKFDDANPWNGASEKYAVGTIVSGRVARMTDFGAFIELEPGIDALLHVSQISKDHVDKPSDVLQKDQEVTAVVVELRENEHKISLSIKAMEEGNDENADNADVDASNDKADEE